MAPTLRTEKGSSLTFQEMDDNFRATITGMTNARELGDSPLAITTNTTYTETIYIPIGFQFVPAAGVNIHFSGGFYTHDENHAFDISAEGSSVTGDSAVAGYTTPEQFGADPTSKLIDDRPAIEAAIEFATLRPFDVRWAHGIPVKFLQHDGGDGQFYYLTKTRPIYVSRTIELFSDHKSFQKTLGAPEIRAADGLAAVMVCFAPGTVAQDTDYEPANSPDHLVSPGIGKLYSAARSRIRGLTFRPENDGMVGKGLVHNCPINVDNCSAAYFSQAGFHAVGQTSGAFVNLLATVGTGNTAHEDPLNPATTIAYNGSAPVAGNVNGSSYMHCFAMNGVAAPGVNGGAHGFVCQGNNAGTVGYYKCDATGNSGVGFFDDTTIGSEFIACHTAQNNFDVDHNGARYQCVKYHVADAASEPGVGVDWETYWVQNTSGTGEAIWALGEEYHPTCGGNSCDRAVSSVIGHYSEGGVEVGWIARDLTSVIGGNAGVRTPYHGERAGAQIVGGGSKSTPVRYEGRTDPTDSATAYGASLGSQGAYKGGRIMQFGDYRDDSVFMDSAMRFSWNNIRKRYEWVDASDNQAVCGYTGTGYTGTGYGGVSQSYFWANGMYLGDGSTIGSRVSRIRTATDFASINDSAFGPAVRGDIWYYTDPSAGGKVGAVCTTGGTIGTDAVIKEFGAIDV